MSTLQLAPPPVTEPVRPLRLPTLVSVELRKMTDTRSARGVLAGTLGLVVFALVWKLTHLDSGPSAFDNLVIPTVNIIAIFGPLLGLLAMTSEWTQRTALTTFTLAPRRLPVIGAKYLASVIVSLGLLAAGLALTAAATGIGGLVGDGSDFAGALGDVRSGLIIVVLQVTMAAAFGALIAQSAGALVAFFVVPIAWDAAGEAVLGRKAAPWFDIYAAYDRLASDDPWSHPNWTLTAVLTFVVLPAAIGVRRSLRREIK
jgi:hypothetical protein